MTVAIARIGGSSLVVPTNEPAGNGGYVGVF